MEYINLEGIDKMLSRLVYGTPASASNGDIENAIETYDMAFEMGFRVFDTAYSYGHGEKMLGKWLTKRGKRNEIVILDKGCNPCATYTTPDIFSADTIRNQVETSLDRLQTDFVELYILHRDDPSKPVDEIVEVLNELQDRGKIKRFGGSNWTMKRIIEANEYAKEHGLNGFSVCSPNYSYMRLIRDPWGGSVTISGNDNESFRNWLTDNQMPVFNYSSLARGFMSGKYCSDNRKPIEECISDAPIKEYYAPENVERLSKAEKIAAELSITVPQVGIAWLKQQKLNLFPIVSPSGEKHLKEIVDALNITLTDSQIDYLNS